MSSDQSEKDQLKQLIQESRKKSEKIVQKSNDLAKFGQSMTDLANASEKVVGYIPASSDIGWRSKIGSWSYANEQQDAILNSIMDLSTATPSGTASAYSMTDL